MPNKARKFDRTFLINISGVSRGETDQITNAEQVVGNMIKDLVKNINGFYQDTDATLEEVDNIVDNNIK